jgi:hypothetical protein
MFFRAIQTTLQLDHLDVSTGGEGFSGILDALPSSCSLESLKALRLNVKPIEKSSWNKDEEVPPVEHEFDLDTMRKLFIFGSLTRFEIFAESPSQFYTSLDDSGLFELAQAWPKLEKLRIPADGSDAPRISHTGPRSPLSVLLRSIICSAP